MWNPPSKPDRRPPNHRRRLANRQRRSSKRRRFSASPRHFHRRRNRCSGKRDRRGRKRDRFWTKRHRFPAKRCRFRAKRHRFQRKSATKQPPIDQFSPTHPLISPISVISLHSTPKHHHARRTNTPPTPAPKKPRAKPGFIDQDLEDAIDLAGDCQREAAKSDVAARLLERSWTAASQQALGASLGRCDTLKTQIKAARTGKLSRTDDEEEARKALLITLDPILKGARRTYPDGSAERKAYGIGESLANSSTGDLLTLATYASTQLAPGANNAPPKDTLKGVLPGEIAALGQLVTDCKDADWAQGKAQQTASQLLAQLRSEVEDTLNPARRDCQGAADQAYTHRDPLNAAQRKAFGLQPDRPLND